MKTIINSTSIELQAETEHEKMALLILRKQRSITVTSADPWGPNEDKHTLLSFPEDSWGT